MRSSGDDRLSHGLVDRVVVVIGAGSSGAGTSNGEAAALTYGRAGARVACLDADPDEARRVAEAVTAEGGVACGVGVDATVEAQVAAAVAEVVTTLGAPDVLHHNVGAAVVGEVLDLGRDAWDAALAVNLTSCYLTARHVLPHLLARGRGSIVTVSSLAALRQTGYPYPAYSAAKAGLNQLTQSLALTYADRGVRANAVVPGLIDTPLARRLGADAEGGETEAAAAAEARHAGSPTGRMGTPWDVAHAALFLAGDLAAYVNGVLLPVDGGLAARCL